MHYKNGRPAQNGDRVVLLPYPGSNNAAIAGILYNAIPGGDECNGRLAITTDKDPYLDLRNVLHADDLAAAANTGIPDTSQTPTPPANTASA